MSQFLRLLNESDKGEALLNTCSYLRKGQQDERIFDVEPGSFKAIPGETFAYWVADEVRELFLRMDAFECDKRIARVTNPGGDDRRYIRAWWEPKSSCCSRPYRWANFSKGGAFSPYFYDVHLVIQWSDARQTYHGFLGTEHRPLEKPASLEHFFRPGLTWPRRTQGGLSLRAMPAGCIFADKGPAAFALDDDPDELLALLALTNSRAFGILVSLQMAFGSYEVGVIQKTPVPDLNAVQRRQLAVLARKAWSLKRTLDTSTETSHAFVLPVAMRDRLGGYDPLAIAAELAGTQAEIDDIAFDLYGFSDEDRQAAQGDIDVACDVEEDSDDEDQPAEAPPLDAQFSWAAGVAFGRFDWRLATGEREAPPEPEPFDPLPAKSPGMLPDGAEPYHRHAGILVDDPGHEHDLPRLMADVLETVDAQADEDLRRWLRRDFFKYHLQQYSKSRRKAPIYWPLATVSGSYTLWLYYPDLTDQTLFTAVNDFVDPKLKQVDSELGNLRLAGASRSRADEKRLEELSDFRDELADLRDTLLTIAQGYKPNHDDGVQITAAPLWPLFRHKPWQKVLKETWEKLEQGDYDWAHLAMAYWPDRVREKCVTDKSLAIAHDLEHLYVEPEPAPKKTRGRKKSTGSSE